MYLREKKKKKKVSNHRAPPQWDRIAQCSNFLPSTREPHAVSAQLRIVLSTHVNYLTSRIAYHLATKPVDLSSVFKRVEESSVPYSMFLCVRLLFHIPLRMTFEAHRWLPTIKENKVTLKINQSKYRELRPP